MENNQSDMLKRLNLISRLVYTGMGLFLAGALLVGIIFANLNTVKADVTAEIEEHQVHIEKEQDKVGDKMDMLTVTVTSLQQQVAVMGSQVTDLKDAIKEERQAHKESMEELKELMREHIVYDHGEWDAP